MARPAATAPMKAAAARHMRKVATAIDGDHPEMMAGDHLRDAARVLEHGHTDGAKRHLDAAMEMMTPRNLVRHGITDDEGHASAKHHMHDIHRARLAVQDIEDTSARNAHLRQLAQQASQPAQQGPPAKVSGSARTPDPGAAKRPGGGNGPSPPGRDPSEPDGPAPPPILMAGWLSELRGFHGEWIRAGRDSARSLHGKMVYGKTPDEHIIQGIYDHTARMVAGVRVRMVQPDPHPVVAELSARTGTLAVTPAPYGKPGGPGLYGVKGQKHSDYFEQIVKALMEKRGMSKGQASAIAYGALRRWRAGGGKVHPEVRAAAAGALAEEATKHGSRHAGDTLASQLIDLVAPAGQQRSSQGSRPQSQNWKNEPRVPKGQPGGGQFGTGGQGKNSSMKGRGMAGKTPGSRARIALRAKLEQQASSIRSQIRALEAMLHPAKSKSTSKSTKAAKAQTPQQAAAAAKAATKAKSKSSTPRKKTAAAMSPATIHGKIIALRAQLRSIEGRIHALSNDDTLSIELASWEGWRTEPRGKGGQWTGHGAAAAGALTASRKPAALTTRTGVPTNIPPGKFLEPPGTPRPDLLAQPGDGTHMQMANTAHMAAAQAVAAVHSQTREQLRTQQPQHADDMHKLMRMIRKSNQNIAATQAAETEHKEKKAAREKLAVEGGALLAGGVIGYVEHKLGVPDLVALASAMAPTAVQVITEWRKRL